MLNALALDGVTGCFVPTMQTDRAEISTLKRCGELKLLLFGSVEVIKKEEKSRMASMTLTK